MHIFLNLWQSVSKNLVFKKVFTNNILAMAIKKNKLPTLVYLAPLLSKKKIVISKFILLEVTTTIKKMYQKHLIIYYFVMKITFQRIKDKNLKVVIKVLRFYNDLLLNHKNIENVLFK